MTSPWDDPFNADEQDMTPVKILWDYEAQLVVGEGVPTFFDTHWTYMHYPRSRLPWRLIRYPGDVLYLKEADVPELVRLAVMVAS